MRYPSAVKGLKTATLPCVNPDTPKGLTTWEWHLPDGHQITVYERKALEAFGGHFHKGLDPSKDPELFLLMRGIVEIRCIDVLGNEKIVTLDASDKKVEMILEPYILHYMRAITDVTYIEYRVTQFDRNASDSWSAEEFFMHFPAAKACRF